MDTPWVMGILNATPDSFYAVSRVSVAAEMSRRALDMLEAGAGCLDVGGYSTRPGAAEVPEDEEYRRLAEALESIRKVAPDALVSVDTFRAGVARRCVEEWGVGIINDVGGGTLDPEMFAVVADLGVAYVLMHMRGTPQTMAECTDYGDVTAEVLTDLAFKLDKLRGMGVADVIIDPGFGFAKTVGQNFELLRNLEAFKALDAPLLAGLSRKSMIWKSLGTDAAGSLNGTTVLNMAALMNGADILRVHDVPEAVECVKLYRKLQGRI